MDIFADFYKDYYIRITRTKSIVQVMCVEYNQAFKSTRQNLRFVNKQLLANHKQAALLSATDSSGKQA